MTLTEVCSNFGIPGTICNIETIKTGNINHTYKITLSDHKSYIVQQINTYVFHKPQQIMSNIDKVTAHIRGKLSTIYDASIVERYVLNFLKTPAGQNYIIDSDNHFYRVYSFIDRSVTYNTADNIDILTKAGEAFGNFQKQLSDFNASLLYEIIPDFHNTKKRFEILQSDILSDEQLRASSVQQEIDFLFSLREHAVLLNEMAEKRELPLRVTHNDTKFNNILFDGITKEPLAVIDLDTVMPGLMAYDFGDAVRYAANSVEEDDPHLQKVCLQLEKFEAFTAGFLKPLISYMTESEIDTLADGAIAVTLELAARFLDDYITGDQYFKIKYPEHNLIRARNQIALAKDMINKRDQMNLIIKKYTQRL